MYNIEGAQWILEQAGDLKGKCVLEFGNQHVWEHAMNRLGIRYPVARDWMLKQLGVAEYVSIDTNGQDHAIPMNLAEPLHSPYEVMLNKFDVVTNIGTTEHIGNSDEAQWAAFCHATNFCRPGGLILHQLPPESMWLDHCDVWYKDGLGEVLAKVFYCDLIVEEHINLPTLNPNVDYLCIALRKHMYFGKSYRSRIPPASFCRKLAR